MTSSNPFAAFFEDCVARDERRKEPRSPYRCVQRIAYPIGDQRDVVEVQFCELSTSGCSFVSLGVPPVKELVVELGRRPNLIYLHASVTYVEPTLFAGQALFAVGCKFTGRAKSLHD